VLAEYAEFFKMLLAVRERVLAPGLAEGQLEEERAVAAALEEHCGALRSLVAKAYLGGAVEIAP
jgi:hypothetical protein